jgi:hypothetical protein
MSRKKEAPPKPLFPLKNDFVAALDNFVHQAGVLNVHVRALLSADLLPEHVAEKLREASEAFSAAHSSWDDEE